MHAVEVAFEALALPLRRHVLDLLLQHGRAMRANELHTLVKKRFDASKFQFRSHLHKLEAGGFVQVERRRQLLVKLDPRGAQVVGAWVARLLVER